MSSSLLVFREHLIRERGEMLNLTDMWRASGVGQNKAPAQWTRSVQARGFVDFLAAVGISHSDIFSIEMGGTAGGGATWGHWQLAMAYAQYLSPEFHAWCNDVVRSHMQQRARTVDVDMGLLQGPRMGDTPEGRERVVSRVMMVKAMTGQSTAWIHGFIRRHAFVSSPYGVSSLVWPTIRGLLDEVAEGRIPSPPVKQRLGRRQRNNVHQLPLPLARH